MSSRGYCRRRWRAQPADPNPPAFQTDDGGDWLDGLGIPSPSPCPFCGNDGKRSPIWMCVRVDDQDRLIYYVTCVKCHCEGAGGFEFSPLVAAVRWNTRGTEDWISAGAEMKAWPLSRTKLN